MHLFTAGPTPEEDSLPYKLTNIITCKPDVQNSIFTIKYDRNNATHEICNVPFAELEAFSPGLVDQALAVEQHYRSPFTSAAYVRALCAHRLGSYIDLNSFGFENSRYRLLCSIQSINPSHVNTYYWVTGTFFRLEPEDCCGVSVERTPNMLVPSTVLEKVWPGVTTAIAIMDNLGYTDQEVVATLLTDGLRNHQAIALDIMDLTL